MMAGKKKDGCFRWQLGRQQTGYQKMLLATSRWPLPFDIYLLKFSEGHQVPMHTDKLDQGRHYRLNLILKQAKQGGEFYCESPLFETSRIKLFRPDISPHHVSNIVAGTRYVLSIGWIR